MTMTEQERKMYDEAVSDAAVYASGMRWALSALGSRDPDLANHIEQEIARQVKARKESRHETQGR